MPRALLELGPQDWLVSDLGGWVGSNGAIWRIRWQAGKPMAEPLITGLRLPHTLAWGSDKLVYASEMGRIFRFDPRAADPAATVQTVIANLPDNRLHANRHPIASFLFDADGALLVNVGAPSDQCLDKRNQRTATACAQSESGEEAASLRRYALVAPGAWSEHYTVHARGLRNSIALARHPSGTVLQGENSYDFESRLQPFEEINVIEAGKHYGWPYCFDNNQPSPGWKGTAKAQCKDATYTRPALLLPPHASPLAMAWYQGAMFPALQGRLLVTWHGFRSVGGRIAAFEVDAKGVPKPTAHASFATYGGRPLPYGAANAATAFILTPQWNKVVGVRPQGSPVGLAVASDGAIWTTDDRAGLVIRIAKDAEP
jgi:glucose/arabinose dehydrogenase